ncbi:MAG: LptA/OstA family protein [Pseudomonadota bacterium]
MTRQLTVMALCAALSMGGAVSAYAQSFADAFGGFRQQENAPISIDANSLDILSQTGQATFQGGVRVVQGPTVLTTGKLVVEYTGASVTEASAIRKLSATGGLNVTTGSRSAKANRGTFDLASNSVILSGDVEVREGDNVARGCRLVVDLNSGNANLESRNCGGASGGGRVQLRITPQSQ